MPEIQNLWIFRFCLCVIRDDLLKPVWVCFSWNSCLKPFCDRMICHTLGV